MHISTLYQANSLRDKIRNLELVLNDFQNNNYDTFCTYRKTCRSGSNHYGELINDTDLAKEIIQLIKEKIAKYNKDFEEL